MKNKPFYKMVSIIVVILLVSCSVWFGYIDYSSDITVKDITIDQNGILAGLRNLGHGGPDDGPGADNPGQDEQGMPDGEDAPPDEAAAPVNAGTISWTKSSDTYAEIDRLMLVNKHNPTPDGYEPPDRIRPDYTASNREASGQYMTREAADAFNALAADAASQGYEIVVTTAYRNYGFQSTLYNNYVAKDGQAAADTYSARPGYSEHQTGLSADVSSPSVNYSLTQDYINTAEGKWLAENCYRYGFIIRFPDGAEDITGYTYEPWHIRYVGQENAKQIYEQGITLEEFLGAEAAPTYL